MQMILFFLISFQIILCDILRPKDNFTNINYEEDMGKCSIFYFLSMLLVGVSGNNSNLTEYEKFQAFKASNCLPLVVLEGLEATKLQLMITDCDALSDDILENCNIMTNKNKHRFVWFSPPGLIKCKSNISEFLVWVSFIGDPVSTLGGGKCLNALFGQHIDYLSQYNNKDAPFIIPDHPGISITWYGNTPNTRKSSNCGVKAGEDIGQTPLPVAELMDYQALYDYTIGMGYQPGLTLLPIPYDWRRMAGNNEVLTTFQRSIEYAYSITGKKVVITAHSFGCLNFLALMNSLPQSFKDQYIDSFLGLACAWTGASYVVDLTTAGLNLGWWDFGYPFSDLRNLIIGLTSLYDLLPKDIFNSTAQWGKEISQRAEQEANWNESSLSQNISFPWFPTPINECYSDRKEDKQCGLHLYNFFENALAFAENSTYMLNSTSVRELLEQYMVRTMEELDFQKLVDEGKVSESEQEEIWGTKKLIPKDRISLTMDMVERNSVSQLINPGVQIHHIYGGHYQTDTWYNITKNPRDYTDKGETADKDTFKVHTHWGDEVVNIDNAITPSLKWAWDFDNGVENAKPVHMIDYCSNYSQLMYKDSTGKYTTTYKNITQNTYNGIMCTNKQHSEFPDDEFIDKYAAVLLQSGKSGIPKINLSEKDVNTITQTCPHIMAPWQIQNVKELYEYGINQDNLQEQNIQYDFPFSQPSAEFNKFLEQFYTNLPHQSLRKDLFVQKSTISSKKKFLSK